MSEPNIETLDCIVEYLRELDIKARFVGWFYMIQAPENNIYLEVKSGLLLVDIHPQWTDRPQPYKHDLPHRVIGQKSFDLADPSGLDLAIELIERHVKCPKSLMEL